MFLLMFISSFFTFVELNCENLFDCTHDSLKNDTEFLPDGSYRWTRTRYWRKLNHIGQALLACGDGKDGWQLPDMVALCEVENDTVMRDLTRRSLLRKARYEYVMTDSPDERGIDVALMYSPFSFALINHRSVRPSPLDGMRPTRDLLYACGLVSGGDTLHVIVTHMPSRRSGERITDRYREHVARYVVALADSIRRVSSEALIIVAGDFNEYSGKDALPQYAIPDLPMCPTEPWGATVRRPHTAIEEGGAVSTMCSQAARLPVVLRTAGWRTRRF